MPVVVLPDGTRVRLPDEPEPTTLERAGDVALRVGSGLAKGAADLGVSVGEAAVLPAVETLGIEKIANAIRGAKPGSPGPIREGFQTLRGLIEGIGPEVQTTGDRYLDVASRGAAGGAVLPFGGIGPSIGYGVLGGVGGEAGEQAFGGDSAMGRILGAVLPTIGVGAGLAGTRKLLGIGNAQDLAQIALSGVTRGENVPDVPFLERVFGRKAEPPYPQNALDPSVNPRASAPSANITLAQSLANQREGLQTGIPGTVAQNLVDSPEALAIQEALLASNNAPLTTALINSQPQRATQAVAQQMTDLPGQQTNMLAAANRAAKAATKKIARVEKAPGMAFRKVLEKEPPGYITREGFEDFEQRLLELAAADPAKSGAGQVQKVIKELRTRLGLDRESVIDPTTGEEIVSAVQGMDPLSVSKILDESLAVFKDKTLGKNALQKNTDRTAGLIRKEFDALLAAEAPSVLKAKATASAVRARTVTPVKESATGQVAGVAGAREGVNAPETAFAILDKGTPVAAGADKTPRSDILTLAKDLNKADPKAFPELVVTNLGKHISEATKRSDGQLSPTFLGDLYKRLYATDAQKQGFREQLVGVARAKKLPDNTFYPGFEKVMRAIQRASQRPAKVSGITTEGARETAEANKLSNVMRAFGFVPFQTAARGVEKYYGAQTFRELDRVFSDPNGIKLLQELATKDPLGPAGQAAIRTYLNETVQEPQEP